MTRVVTAEEAEAVLASLRNQYGLMLRSASEMEISWEHDEDGEPERCTVSWYSGPFEWSYVSPQEGGSADGYDVPKAENWPEGVWTQAVNEQSVTLWSERD